MSRNPSKSGPFGETEPPRDWKEWRDFIRAVCGEIKAAYPQEVLDHLRFKIGNEYNSQENFSGSYEDYLKLYDYSAATALWKWQKPSAKNHRHSFDVKCGS